MPDQRLLIEVVPALADRGQPVERGHQPLVGASPRRERTSWVGVASCRGPQARQSVTFTEGESQAYNHGLREGWVTTNPATLARPPREVHSRREQARLRWTPQELVAFRAHVDRVDLSREPWLRAAMRLTLCGMRRSEVLGLDWEQVDLDAGTVEVLASRVRTGRGTDTVLGPVKTANSLRLIQAEVIHPGTAAALRALWLVQGRPDEGLVIRDTVGELVAPDRYSARFRELCAEAGPPVLRSIHNVRHTLATALKTAGVADHEAAALFGHDVDTFRRFYLVTDDDGAATAAQAAGRLFAV